jgi:flagellar secretion chaperone FliS
MSYQNQYKAYSMATGTVAKTRQVVMLYDNIIKLIKQVKVAIDETRIEDRFTLLKKASDTIVGLQSSIDFDNGGDIAGILHNFYTNISMRIVGVNFIEDTVQAQTSCDSLIDELKQMRDVWDNIDKNNNTPTSQANASSELSGITISA